ncbi:MAG: hypothetical protein QHJ82_04155 [Verrucomicrobiota bacterium]|nr:hypothetical protein [Verrucomicrobiota bacterium]
MLTSRLICVAVVVGLGAARAGQPQLSVSVYATAGDVQSHLASTEARTNTLPMLTRLGVSRVFLEGRRGDEYVDPATLATVRDYLKSHGIDCSGGIATVPGKTFGVRQTGGLDWLDWESEKTRADVSGFFRENARVFDELIIDDFFCTGDVSAQADRARAGRSWSAYRRDLLVSLIGLLVHQPARETRQNVRLIIKFPQWYDRFHLFGYDPVRMAGKFDKVWVGTEVRNPRTRRMGFVQPTQGYVNFMWIRSIAGEKVRGAWFDHIECSAFNFIDQACMSVLAGARELTLFRLGDVAAKHPGDALLAERLPELIAIAKSIQNAEPDGVYFYKPPNSDADDNLFLADYLGMIGLPIVPVATYPDNSRVVFLAAHAVADPDIQFLVKRHLRRGATLILTPSFLRKSGRWAQDIAGAVATGLTGLGRLEERNAAANSAVVEVDSSLKPTTAGVLSQADCNGLVVPLLTHRQVGAGRVLVLNIRSFSDTDYRGTGEYLLPPTELGWARLPQQFLDPLRATLLRPLGMRLDAPAGVIMCVRGKSSFIYNVNDEPAMIRLGSKLIAAEPHRITTLD